MTHAVKGAPYAADVSTESVQVLADGNRILNTQASRQFRDSEGRARTDATMQVFGAVASQGQAPAISNIVDPVAGAHYFLNHEMKTVSKAFMKIPAAASGSSLQSQDVQVEVRHAVAGGVGAGVGGGVPGGVGHFDVLTPGPGPTAMFIQRFEGNGADVKKESLGKQTIEGLECDGTRTTATIPAGQIGNERSIVITDEAWYSPKLQMAILTRHSDPRFGESTMKVTRIVQGEQPRSLFEPPADYKVEEPGKGGTLVIRKEEIRK
jgi:hypothetical protein